jgi:hypothetical protein
VAEKASSIEADDETEQQQQAKQSNSLKERLCYRTVLTLLCSDKASLGHHSLSDRENLISSWDKKLLRLQRCSAVTTSKNAPQKQRAILRFTDHCACAIFIRLTVAKHHQHSTELVWLHCVDTTVRHHTGDALVPNIIGSKRKCTLNKNSRNFEDH